MKRILFLPALALLAGCTEKPTPGAGATTTAPEPKATTAAAPTSTATATGAAAMPSGAPTAASPSATPSAAPAAPLHLWSFDKDKADGAPAGFDLVNTGGKAGKWVIKADPTAPSGPNVLAQLDTDKTDARFAAAVATEAKLKDASVAVRCKLIAGKVDQACGVILRYKDEKNYYVGRVNGLEKDVNLYVVKDGKRKLLGGWKGATIGEAWHEIRLDVKGDKFSLFWDKTQIAEATDATLADAGRVGVWVKADSVTYFDDLSVTEIH